MTKAPGAAPALCTGSWRGHRAARFPRGAPSVSVVVIGARAIYHGGERANGEEAWRQATCSEEAGQEPRGSGSAASTAKLERYLGHALDRCELAGLMSAHSICCAGWRP